MLTQRVRTDDSDAQVEVVGDKTNVCAIIPQCSRWDFVCPHHSWVVQYSATASTWPDFRSYSYSTSTGTPVFDWWGGGCGAAPYNCHFLCVGVIFMTAISCDSECSQWQPLAAQWVDTATSSLLSPHSHSGEAAVGGLPRAAT